jgi:hypothetical protein
VTADAEAYATGVIAETIKENGLEAAQYQVALKQVEAMQAIAVGRASRPSCCRPMRWNPSGMRSRC